MDNYNESSSVEGSELEEEYDNTFDGEERVQLSHIELKQLILSK